MFPVRCPGCHLLLTFFMILPDHLKQAHFNSAYSLPYLYITIHNTVRRSAESTCVLCLLCDCDAYSISFSSFFFCQGQPKVTFCAEMRIFVNEKEAKMVRIRKEKVISTPEVSTLGNINIITFFLILFDSLQHSNEIFVSPLDPFITLHSLWGGRDQVEMAFLGKKNHNIVMWQHNKWKLSLKSVSVCGSKNIEWNMYDVKRERSVENL